MYEISKEKLWGNKKTLHVNTTITSGEIFFDEETPEQLNLLHIIMVKTRENCYPK